MQPLRCLPAILALAGCSSTITGTAGRDAGVDVVSIADMVLPQDVADVVQPDVPSAMDVPTVTDVGTPSDDAPILPAWDSGELPLDAGGLGEPAWVPLQVLTSGTCTPLVPCGGNVVGTWDVSGGCFQVTIPAQLMACPGAAVTHSEGSARGRVIFTSDIAQRESQWDVEVDLYVPLLCADFVGGCSGLESVIHNVYPDSACTAASTGDCNCAVRDTGMIDDSGGYTTMDDEIVSASLVKRWEYCIAGTQLTYKDVSTTGPLEPGIIQLTQR